jgi:hypothetical protein
MEQSRGQFVSTVNEANVRAGRGTHTAATAPAPTATRLTRELQHSPILAPIRTATMCMLLSKGKILI